MGLAPLFFKLSRVNESKEHELSLDNYNFFKDFQYEMSTLNMHISVNKIARYKTQTDSARTSRRDKFND